MNLFQTKRYLGYYFRPNHWRGYGIQSPFAFDFAGNLLREKHPYYDFAKIEAWHAALKRSKETIEILDLGAGGQKQQRRKRRLSSIVSRGATPPKYGQLLYRIACRFGASNILELGTSCGISTLYIAMPYKKGKAITIEGCPQTAKVAKVGFDRLGADHIDMRVGSFDELLPKALKDLPQLDLVFFDGDHREESTLRYFEQCLPYIHNDTIFVFDDIHWSHEMERAWNKIAKHPKVKLSLDLMRIGIVFFRKENQKEHFVLRY